MFSLRQLFQLGTRLSFMREPVNLHWLASISREKVDINRRERIFVRMKTNVCESSQTINEEPTKKPLGKLEGKLKLAFTCKRCSHRNNNIISKLAYEKGVVIVRCNGCKNNHLIADHLGWFTEMKAYRNIERLLAAKGETVTKILNDVEGYVEVVPKEKSYFSEYVEEEGHLMEKKKSEICIEKKNYESSGDK
ncbi:uncharacterized protein LOC128875531 [Hylaeus volcanicus]|uniref:uncharacterized protein LOC128875531 n=1 Tax=Hylaeus volcanicus TaxID=313075 RepID=UPI0023B7EF68|nr:uncharacterized protein LOC128875531 [Hylaeus volcanicus]XP_053977146.1 uncharacterized protein LOC128875531 [Hylaeus volcanicus]